MAADTVPGIPDAFFGPAALLVASLTVVGILWRDHQAKVKEALAAKDAEIAGLKEQMSGGFAYREGLRAEAVAGLRLLEDRVEALTNGLRESVSVATRSADLMERVVVELSGRERVEVAPRTRKPRARRGDASDG